MSKSNDSAAGGPMWPALRLMTAGEAIKLEERVTLDDSGLVVPAAAHPKNAAAICGKALGAGDKGSLIEVLFDV